MSNYNLKKVLCQLNQWCATNNFSVQSVYDECHGMTLQELVYYLLGVVKEAVNQVVENTDAFQELYNFVHDYFDNLDVQEEINNKLEEMYNSGQLNELLNLFIPYVTPEMFGAKGDGVTDDSSAIQAMINYVTNKVPKYIYDQTSGNYCYDFSGVKFIFSSIYAVSATITIPNCWNLSLSNMSLTALSDFNGDCMLHIQPQCRNSHIDKILLNGNRYVNKLLYIQDYTLNLSITESTFIKFKTHGIYIDGNGHEIFINKNKVYQYEIYEWNSEEIAKLSTGIGIYLSNNRHDNSIVDNIINYCVEYGLTILGTANRISLLHTYLANVNCVGNYNFFSNCYFDGTYIRLSGASSVINSDFSTNDTKQCIELIEPVTTNWMYQLSEIRSNIFRNNVNQNINNNIIIVDNYTLSDINILISDNSFAYTKTFVTKVQKTIRPSSYQILPDLSQGNMSIGNFLIQSGTTATGGAITFDKSYDYYDPIVMVTPVASGTTVAYPVSITREGFTLSDTGGRQHTWMAIGRYGY